MENDKRQIIFVNGNQNDPKKSSLQVWMQKHRHSRFASIIKTNNDKEKMSDKNGGQTTSTEFVEQLDDSPLDLLTMPTHTLKVEQKPNEKNSSGAWSPNPDYDLKTAKKTISQAKERMTVQISKDTIERVKDCVYWNRLTVAQFVEEALKDALKEAEKENGKPFQKRRSELKAGRPTK